jgi:hypothetical protein
MFAARRKTEIFWTSEDICRPLAGFPLGGGAPVTIGSATLFDWALDGSSLSMTSESGAPIPEGRSYLIPLPRGQALPRIPAGGGFHTEEEIARLPGAHTLRRRSPL